MASLSETYKPDRLENGQLWEKIVAKALTTYPHASQRVLSALGSINKISTPAKLIFEVRQIIRERYFNGTEQIGHEPRRIDSPHPNDKFQARVDTGEAAEFDELLHYIIGCSSFDEKGRVNRFVKKVGFLERGATMTLDALTPDEIDGCKVRVRTADDLYEDIPYDEILEQARGAGTKVAISLAGIQTNQFPRAIHIAEQLKKRAVEAGVEDKIDILFGGYHLRGDESSREEVAKRGFTAVNGEAEDGRLGNILTDSVHGRLQPLYEWKDKKGREQKVGLKGNPMPAPQIDKIHPTSLINVQFSRGCPFPCKFCSVRGIDGNKVRVRSAEEAKASIDHLVGQGVMRFFIGDDNFYRNPNRMEILDALIEYRRQGIPVTAKIQTDLKVVKNGNGEEVVDEEFMNKCAEAGITSVFCGVESFDYDVLASMGKKQNIRGGREKFIDDMRRQRQAWNDRGVEVNASCMIGSEHDKPGVGKRTAETALEIGVNNLSAYIFGIAPGSDDSKMFAEHPEIAEVDGRYNLRMTNAVIKWNKEGALTPEQIEQEHKDLNATFYRPENIRRTCISFKTLRLFVWNMLSTRFGYSGMNNGLIKRRLCEKLDDDERDEILSLGQDFGCKAAEFTGASRGV